MDVQLSTVHYPNYPLSTIQTVYCPLPKQPPGAERYAIAPALQWRKDKNEEALWSLSIRASYAF
jgi:hypothetical protein